MAQLIKPAAGAPVVLFQDATAGGTKAISCVGANALLILHAIAGATNGGYVSLNLKAGGATVPHHGKGAGIKTAAQAASYASLFEGVTDEVEVTLNRTDGTHTVVAIPLVV